MKLILMYCGYNNCHTISAITPTDLKYVVTQVRQGNVTNFYSAHGISDAMEGSKESAENFKFILGHERFLMAIVNFVKQHLCDYGASIFDASEDTPKIDNEHLVKLKRSKDVDNIPLMQDKRHDVICNSLEIPHSIRRVHADIIEHQHTLLKMAVISLSVYTPQMYEEVSSRLVCFSVDVVQWSYK